MTQTTEHIRIRIKFTKQGDLRYIGHLDLHHIWQRSIRRTDLKLAYSQGFHPQPKIQLASALPLGFSSRAEVVDIWLEDLNLSLPNLKKKLQDALPKGITVLDLQEVERRAPALQTMGDYAEYKVTLLDEIPVPSLKKKLAALMEADALPREKKKKKRGKIRTYDLRPLILALKIHPTKEDEPAKLFMRLAAREGATGRPDAVLAELGIPVKAARVERTALIFKEKE